MQYYVTPIFHPCWIQKRKAADVAHPAESVDDTDNLVTDTVFTRSWNYNKFSVASQHQDTADIFLSVLKFAAWTLKLDGHLVFWMPYLVNEFTEDDIPAHPDFLCLYHLPQQMTMLYGRRMCVLKRISTEESVTIRSIKIPISRQLQRKDRLS